MNSDTPKGAKGDTGHNFVYIYIYIYIQFFVKIRNFLYQLVPKLPVSSSDLTRPHPVSTQETYWFLSILTPTPPRLVSAIWYLTTPWVEGGKRGSLVVFMLTKLGIRWSSVSPCCYFTSFEIITAREQVSPPSKTHRHKCSHSSSFLQTIVKSIKRALKCFFYITL